MDFSEKCKRLELELLTSSVRCNRERLDELISNDFIEFGSSGNTSCKSDVLNSLPLQEQVIYDAMDFNLKQLSPDFVHLTYKLKKTVVSNGLTTHTLRSSIWRCTKNKCQMFFHQGTVTD